MKRQRFLERVYGLHKELTGGPAAFSMADLQRIEREFKAMYEDALEEMASWERGREKAAYRYSQVCGTLAQAKAIKAWHEQANYVDKRFGTTVQLTSWLLLKALTSKLIGESYEPSLSDLVAEQTERFEKLGISVTMVVIPESVKCRLVLGTMWHGIYNCLRKFVS